MTPPARFVSFTHKTESREGRLQIYGGRKNDSFRQDGSKLFDNVVFPNSRTPGRRRTDLLQRRPLLHLDPAAKNEPAPAIGGEDCAFAVFEVG
jgi:hypothetical protein